MRRSIPIFRVEISLLHFQTAGRDNRRGVTGKRFATGVRSIALRAQPPMQGLGNFRSSRNDVLDTQFAE